MQENIFMRIINKEVKADIVYEDIHVLAFKDINPIASVHILIVPKKFYKDLDSIPDADFGIVSHICLAAKKIAYEFGISGSYKLMTNVGEKAGQSVFHLHFHLISSVTTSEREISF